MHIFSKAFYSITLRYPILFFDNVHIKAHAIYRKARVSIFLRQHIPVVQLEQYQLYNSSYTSCTTGIVRVAHPVASLLKDTLTVSGWKHSDAGKKKKYLFRNNGPKIHVPLWYFKERCQSDRMGRTRNPVNGLSVPWV